MNENKIFLSKKIKTINTKDRTVQAIISDESVDRDGEILIQDGLKVDNFMKNPVVLYNHGGSPFSSKDSLPIGRVEKIQKFKNETHATIKFAAKSISQRAEQVFQLFKGGFMNTFSIGFRVTEPPVQTEKGLELPQTELLELSAVTIPANPNAVAKNYRGNLDNFKKLCKIMKNEIQKFKNESEDPMESKEIIKDLVDAIKVQNDTITSLISQVVTKNEESQEEETKEETTEEATDDDTDQDDETAEADAEDDEEETEDDDTDEDLTEEEKAYKIEYEKALSEFL